MGDFSVIDSEFSNIRERFDSEMRKMEDEMAKFRSELINREQNNFFEQTSRLLARITVINCRKRVLVAFRRTPIENSSNPPVTMPIFNSVICN